MVLLVDCLHITVTVTVTVYYVALALRVFARRVEHVYMQIKNDTKPTFPDEIGPPACIRNVATHSKTRGPSIAGK